MAIDDNASYELTGYQVKDLASKIRAKADSNSLASVATSGLYSDLTGAPTIPTVYNGTLTLQQNGSTLGTFSANQSGNETINFTSGGKLNNLWWGIEDPEYPSYKNLYAGDPTTLPVLISFPGVSTMFDEGMIQLIDQVDNQTYVVVSIDSTNYSILAVRADGSSGAKEFVTFSTTSGSSSTWTKTVTSLEPFTGATSGAAGTSGLVPAPTTSDVGKYLKGDGTWGTPTGTTYSDFTGATSSVAGAHGLVPAPAAGDNTKVLTGDGTWKLPGLTILKYGTSTYNEALAAYQANNLLYCRASSNSNPGTGDQLRMAFLAYVNAEGTPTEFEFQYYRSVSSKTVTNQGDETFVYKLNKNTGWSVTKRNNYTRITTDSSLTDSFASGVLTLSANTMTGATSGAAGTAGYVPAPAAGDEDKYLKGDGTWSDLSSVRINSKFMQTGEGSITYQTQGSGGGGVNVTFDTPFDHAPVVVASTKGPYSANAIEVHVQSPSTTGFSILARTAGSTQETGNFQWVAIDPLAAATVGLASAPDDSLNYSTSEVDTGHTWIDGKTIYKKTINFGALPNATTKNVAHGISNLSRVIKMEGYAYRSGDGTFFSIPFTSTATTSADIMMTVNGTDVQLGTGVDRSNIAECYITIYYTKSS